MKLDEKTSMQRFFFKVFDNLVDSSDILELFLVHESGRNVRNAPRFHPYHRTSFVKNLSLCCLINFI